MIHEDGMSSIFTVDTQKEVRVQMPALVGDAEYIFDVSALNKQKTSAKLYVSL